MKLLAEGGIGRLLTVTLRARGQGWRGGGGTGSVCEPGKFVCVHLGSIQSLGKEGDGCVGCCKENRRCQIMPGLVALMRNLILLNTVRSH